MTSESRSTANVLAWSITASIIIVFTVFAIAVYNRAPEPLELSDSEVTYLMALDEKNVPYAEEGIAVDIGHEVCSNYVGGESFIDIREDVKNAGDWGPTDSKVVVIMAVNILCPQYTSDLVPQP